MKTQVGSLGQFDVVVDGQVIASRGGTSLLKRLLGGGFPDAEDVLAKIEALQKAKAQA